MVNSEPLQTQKAINLVNEFYKAVRNEDQEKFWSLIHEDFVLWSECLKINKKPPEIAGSIYEYDAFMKIATELSEPLKELREDLKKSHRLMLNHVFWRKENLSNYDFNITDVVGNDEFVWVKIDYNFTMRHSEKIILVPSYERFWISDNKIRSFVNDGNHFYAVQQMGEISVSKTDIIDRYIKAVKEAGFSKT